MKRTLLVALLGLSGGLVSVTSQAALISVSNGLSTAGVTASIISAPGDVRDDAAENAAQQGFNELQDVTLGFDLEVDGTSTIAAGTTVDSHMIFLNSDGFERIRHSNVEWMFDGLILGVMSDTRGRLEAGSNALLGLDMEYQGTGLRHRGLERRDSYEFFGNTLELTMVVREPGDWIRVITASAVPEPSIIALFGLGLLGLGFARRRIHS